MTNTLSLLVLSAFVLGPATAVAQQPAKASDTRSRDLYVSVLDDKGNAVSGLGVADFAVREDGTAREVIRVAPATASAEIIFLIDDSQAATNAIPYIRDGLTKFVDRMQGKAAIGIVTFGERPTSVVERTTDAGAVKKGIGRIFARSGAGAYLLEGIMEVSRGIRMRESERPIIIAIATEGVEFSNAQAPQVLRDLYASGATLHVIALGTPSGSLSDETRNRNIVVSEGTEGTGGRREQVLADMAITGTLEKIADEILKQQVVTYGRPESLIPPEKVQVTVTKPGLKARARTRLAHESGSK